MTKRLTNSLYIIREKIGPKSVAGSQTHMRESVHMFQKLEQEGVTAWVLFYLLIFANFLNENYLLLYSD